ncbi:MAG: NADH-quinone oxidoreductase subunit H [Spirochaetes bacterium]|nr:NADH-quinone oxidoreductase subunit H [Spirochaetota bacterium]
MIKTIIHFLVFPGFLFLSVAGGFVSWFDRKITARVHFRKGPPLLQPFYDFIKLLAKETLIPKNSSPGLFLLAPVISFTATILAGILIILPAFGIESGFQGDLIVIIYLLMIPAISLIFGALASGNPLSSLGASREIKLLISYELPFLLTLLALVIRTDMSIKIQEIISEQKLFGPFIGSFSGALGFIVMMMCVQAKLALVPFDLAEAETEIVAGAYTEYSGTPLALFKITRYMLFFIMPSFVVILFLGGFDFKGWNIILSIGKVLLIALLITLVRNTNPRVKIKAAMKFFLVWMNLFAILSVILAVLKY